MSTFFKGALAGGAGAAAVIAATAALAGTGVGAIFNLGVANTVDAQTSLAGTSAGAQLQVTNADADGAGVRAISTGTGAAAVGVDGRSALGRGVLGLHTGASGTVPGVEGRSAATVAGAAGVVGQMTSASAAGLSAGVWGINRGAGYGVRALNGAAGAAALHARNTGGGPAATFVVEPAARKGSARSCGRSSPVSSCRSSSTPTRSGRSRGTWAGRSSERRPPC